MTIEEYVRKTAQAQYTLEQFYSAWQIARERQQSADEELRSATRWYVAKLRQPADPYHTVEKERDYLYNKNAAWVEALTAVVQAERQYEEQRALYTAQQAQWLRELEP